MNTRLITLLLFILGWSAMGTAEITPGETLYGFKVLDARFVEEVNARVIRLVHEQSGAQVLKIANDDANKTFSIAFKTIPESDCGTPHIMEHSVLNGSKHFPVKSPFDILARGSLNTFLNAMTGSDITIYPIASMNDTDYFNLMHVYLDAVFYPLAVQDPRIFYQEGWHHELTDPEEPIVYKGVVYNEMKGAYSDPNRILEYQADRHLFPDSPYGYSSGGYPTAIPDLSYDDFVAFHETYYHPDNSFIFLYGDADLDTELEFIHNNYLSHFEQSGRTFTLPLQKPFYSMREQTEYYPVTEESDLDNQTYLSMSWIVGKNTDRSLYMSLDVLTDVLVNHESAPIRNALQEAEIGRDVSAYVAEQKQNVVKITVKNANPEDKDRFRQIVMETLQRVADEGVDRESLEGTLNRMEFRLREGDDAQKGLRYNFQSIRTWFYAQDPYLGLEWEKPLATLKTALDSDLLEETIQHHLIDNPHKLLLVLEPKPGMEQEQSADIKTHLADLKASMSDADIDSLVSSTQELIEHQQREDSPDALATIPLLERKDISPKAEWYGVDEREIDGIPVLYHPEFTNNVVYMQLLFDARVLPEELLPYAGLLAECLSLLNTERYSYGDLDNALNIHTGGFNTSVTSFLKERDDSQLLPIFSVSGKAMAPRVEKLLQLTDEILTRSRFEDPERLKDVLTRHQAQLDARVKSNGFPVAVTRARSYFSRQGLFTEKTRGLDYYRFVTALVDSFDTRKQDIMDNLTRTAELLFNRNNLIVAVTCDENNYSTVQSHLPLLAETLRAEKSTAADNHWTVVPRNEGMMTSSKVQYVVQGYNFKTLGYEWSGKLRVLDQVLSRDYLQTQLRVLGGAYGGFTDISPNGQFLFLSYRDPNLSETLENYKKTTDFLTSFEATEDEMTRFIIGTIANMDRPLTPSQKGRRAVRYHFETVSREDLQTDRTAVLNTTPTDLQDMAGMVSDIIDQQIYCVYGNQEKLESEKQLFDTLITLRDSK